jgi:hypothetical protein
MLQHRLMVNSTDVWEARTMSVLSQRSIETLLDLVEIKLSCLEVYDREDAREKSCLENARKELSSMKARRLTALSPAACVAA